MSVRTSLTGQDSVLFKGKVGTTYSSRMFHKDNRILGKHASESDGMWAFCRFDHKEIMAARIGFQSGGFNITDRDVPIDPSALQLHLEILTVDGGLIWLPTGVFRAGDMTVSGDQPTVSLNTNEVEIVSISGWPDMVWHFQAADASMETRLEIEIAHVTVVPDCILPYCIFAMWISVGKVRGWVRIGDKTEQVRGRVFLDHPRIRRAASPGNIRKNYLYTTLSFEDNSAFYSYYAEDGSGNRIPYYSFATFVSNEREHSFSTGTELLSIEFDEHRLPRFWELRWTDGTHAVHARVSVRENKILKMWGSDNNPKSLREFIYYPLVLDCTATIENRGKTVEITGIGLAEYFDIDA